MANIYGTQRTVCAHTDKSHLVNCVSTSSSTSPTYYEDRVYHEIPQCTRLSAIYSSDHCRSTLNGTMKTPDPAVSLMLPQSPLDYNTHNSNMSIQRRIPPPPERRKSVKPIGVSWRFRVFNENTAVLFFLAFVLTLALFVAQAVFKNSFLTLYSRHEIIDLTRTDANLEIGKSTSLRAPPRRLTYTTVSIPEKANLALMFNTTNSARFVVYAMRTLSPTPTLYDYRRVVNVDRLHSQGVVIRDEAVEDVFYESDNRNGLVTFPVNVGEWHIALLNDHIEPLQMTVTPFLFDENLQNGCKFECFGKGSCQNGSCQCFPGYSGKYCQETSCPILCSGNGVFSNGECVCHQGYHGKICEKIDRKPEPSYLQSFDGAFQHTNIMPVSSELYAPKSTESSFQAEKVSSEKSLKIDPKPTEISTTKSSITCHNGGTAEGPICRCRHGFGGEKCDEVKCPNDCNGRGRCLEGVCQCENGWNGKDCGINGCPNHCNGNGKCRRSNGKYSCKCNELFFGESCNYRTEAVCDDGLDNDNDGLADCLDPDCCSSTHCQANPLCMTTSTNQTRPKTSTRSSQDFFDKMNYLIQPGSAQRYADHKAFKRSLFSVLKMKIVDEKAGPLMGMRVVNEMKPKQGFTLTNEAGEAELAVNGGGYVQLSLLRHPFGLLHYNLFVPANQLLDLGTLSISQLQHPSSYNSTSKCAEKLAENPMKIRIFNDFSQFSEVIPDNFDMKIENEISLSYSDKGSVLIFKWEEKSLENVENVLMKISAAGRVFEFDLKPRKEFVFEFDGENEHGEKVEGAVDALVKVGYKYQNCDKIYWNAYKEKIIVKAADKKCCGPLGLNVEHFYDSKSNLFQYGNGTVIDLNQYKSLQPVKTNISVASNSDQVLVLADGSIILKQNDKILHNGNVILDGFDFKHARMSVDPLRNEVNVLFEKTNKVIKIRSIEKFSSPVENFQVVLESQSICNGDVVGCLNGKTVQEANFKQIQDIAFDKRGNLLFLDSNALFYIENSLIHLLGQFSSLSFSTKCLKTFALKDLGLHSAQRILIDPLTGHLILLDKNALIYRIDIHNQIAHRIYNGLHDCGQNSEASRIHSVNHIEIDVNSNNLIVFGFLKNGELTVQSVDLNSDEISTIVKDLRRCKCLKVGCKCSEEESKNDAYAVTSVSVGGKGQILFTTSNPFGIFKLSPLEIFFDKSLATFTITLPNSSEFHTFDRNGRLLSTVKSTTLQRKREFRRELSEKSAKTDLILASGEHLSVTQEAPNKWSITHGNGRRMEVQVHEGVVEIREDGKLIKKMEFTVNGRLLRTDLDEIL
ncbi:unnamed protein product [Bursaphelenchus xylophilus]|nr:unnamed protein product [Bursaphelenchus xylophilus]CAG9105015.1 unnamed protein product [Bursaphelenchus xylophilus]